MNTRATLCKFFLLVCTLCVFLAMGTLSHADGAEETEGCCGDTNLLVLYRGSYPDDLKEALHSLESRYFIGIETVDTEKSETYAPYRIFSEPVLIFYNMEGERIGIRFGAMSAEEIIDTFNARMSPLTEIRPFD